MKLAILWSISLKSKNMKKNNIGFMVFEDSGNSPLSYGACKLCSKSNKEKYIQE